MTHTLRGHEYHDKHPFYMTMYSCCIPAVNKTKELIESTMKLVETLGPNTDLDNVELELRFGNCRDNNSFQAGVTETAFRNVQNRLDSSREFVESRHRFRGSEVSSSSSGTGSDDVDDAYDAEGWYTTHVYHHRDINKRSVRTETVIPTTRSSPDRADTPMVSITHIHKKIIDKVNFRSVNLTREDLALTHVDMRMALSVEQHVSLEDIDRFVNADSVHIKKRKDYTFCPANYDSPTWRYTLTQRWVGKNLNGAEMDYKTKPPVYEIELELIRPQYLFQKESQEVAYSLLMKASDLLGFLNPTLKNKECYAIEPQVMLQRSNKHR